MSKKRQSQFDKNVNEAFYAIKQAVTSIATHEAAKYEVEIYKRLRDMCNEQIEVINDVERYSAGYACERIRKVMDTKGGNE